MSIFVDKNTKVIVQGITGRDGSFHTKKMIEYGTNIVGGVTPFKEGEKVEDVPVFSTVKKAVKETGADASILYIPPKFAADAICEAVDAGIKTIVTITEGIPFKDMLQAVNYAKNNNVRLIGPNCPGIITPGETKLGIMPAKIFKKGNIGVISRSGTLTYEVVYNLTSNGFGQSTAIGIGGDPYIGTKFIDCLKEFEKDNETDAVVLIGEIGGNDEQIAAEYIKNNMQKPVIAFISGKTAPKGKRMGHAGAIISGSGGSASEKIKVLKNNKVEVAELPTQIADILKEKL